MTIKLVATDMDGTFLTDDKHFDQERFQKIYDYMQAHQIYFVSASCNQYYQLKNFFKAFPKVLFVAENGALIATHQEILATYTFTPELVQKVLNVLQQMPAIQPIVCAKESAYVLDDVPLDFYRYSSFYFPHIKKVAKLADIDDQVFKFSVRCPELETDDYLKKLAKAIGPEVSVVSSGQGDIDIIRVDINKATGLQYLSQKLNISPEQMCAFGDGGNDLEMLSIVGSGVAMKNAPTIVKKTAPFQTSDNNQQGVLKYLEAQFNL